MSESEERIIQHLKQEWKKKNKDELIEILRHFLDKQEIIELLTKHIRPHTKPKNDMGEIKPTIT